MTYISGLVSIVMPAHNSERYISESIESIISQTYPNWELIIIDDASTDNTASVVKEIEDNRITLVSNKINLGVALSRNKAIELSRGQYLAFLDSDDIWMPTKLEQQIETIKTNENAVCCHTAYTRFYDKSKKSNLVRARRVVTFETLLKSNFIGNLTGLIDRSKVEQVIQKTVKHEDYLMWLEILSSKPDCISIGIDQNLAKYRVHSSSLSANKLRSAMWHWNVLNNIQSVSRIKAIYFFSNYLFYSLVKRNSMK